MADDTVSNKPPKLNYKESASATAPSNPTLVFLHGLYSSPSEFNDVCCCLTDYNLILIDHPGHNGSRHIPFSLENATAGVHAIIKEKGLLGKAHIIGLSLGGFVALDFARRYPGAAASVFSTGATPFRGWQKWMAERPRITYPLMSTLVMGMPDACYWWICKQSGIRRHDDLRQHNKSNCTFDLVRDGYGGCLQVQLEQLQDITQTRIMLVAGGKQDDVETTKLMCEIIQKKCPGSRAFVVKNAVHGWDLQFPSVFAEGVRAWVEASEELPEEFEELI